MNEMIQEQEERNCDPCLIGDDGSLSVGVETLLRAALSFRNSEMRKQELNVQNPAKSDE